MPPEPKPPIPFLVRLAVRDLRALSRLEPRRAMGVPALSWALALIDRLVPIAAAVDPATFSWLAWPRSPDPRPTSAHTHPHASRVTIRLHVEFPRLLAAIECPNRLVARPAPPGTRSVEPMVRQVETHSVERSARTEINPVLLRTILLSHLGPSIASFTGGRGTPSSQRVIQRASLARSAVASAGGWVSTTGLARREERKFAPRTSTQGHLTFLSLHEWKSRGLVSPGRAEASRSGTSASLNRCTPIAKYSDSRDYGEVTGYRHPVTFPFAGFYLDIVPPLFAMGRAGAMERATGNPAAIAGLAIRSAGGLDAIRAIPHGLAGIEKSLGWATRLVLGHPPGPSGPGRADRYMRSFSHRSLWLELRTLRVIPPRNEVDAESPALSSRITVRPELTMAVPDAQGPSGRFVGRAAVAETLAAEVIAARSRVEAIPHPMGRPASGVSPSDPRVFARVAPLTVARPATAERQDVATRDRAEVARHPRQVTDARSSPVWDPSSQAALQTITDQVVRALDDRIAAHRERFGRI